MYKLQNSKEARIIFNKIHNLNIIGLISDYKITGEFLFFSVKNDDIFCLCEYLDQESISTLINLVEAV